MDIFSKLFIISMDTIHVCQSTQALINALNVVKLLQYSEK